MKHPKLLFTAHAHDSQRLILEIVGSDGTWQIPIDKDQAERLGKDLVQLSTHEESDVDLLTQFLDELMIDLPGGVLWMGSMPGEQVPEEELPRHSVTLGEGFSVAALPVTQGLYRMIMGENPSVEKGSKKPVESISWFDAIAFCNALSTQQGLEPAYVMEDEKVTWNRESNGYRLPTEAEWEYAARTKDDLYYSGSDQLHKVGWHSGNTDSLPDVGKKNPNHWGFYDLSGGVFEWCWDWNGPYAKDAETDPTGSEIGFERVCRGGAWNLKAWYSRTTCRYAELPEVRVKNIGMRLARNLV